MFCKCHSSPISPSPAEQYLFTHSSGQHTFRQEFFAKTNRFKKGLSCIVMYCLLMLFAHKLCAESHCWILTFSSCLACNLWKCCTPWKWTAFGRDLMCSINVLGICITLWCNGHSCKEKVHLCINSEQFLFGFMAFWNRYMHHAALSTLLLSVYDDDNDDDDAFIQEPVIGQSLVISPGFIV